MFITVLYGDYEALICNPCCAVANLLDNIKERCGLITQMNTELDLADETGLVLELTDHKNDDALKYLTIKGEYILVEKRVTIIEPKDASESLPQQEITYVPLLKRLHEKYPEYVTHVAQRCITQSKQTKPKKGKRKKMSNE